ncbi:short-chain dehydrogenase/reductase [Oceaniglobus roseus]|uniref:short-chain dehydrogenase/reductase n=1 Tax=Oceaniglobus roseus TaxID=1737570 RepID=UPI000C7EBFA9|nr:short-chain dehydrogenase/reductase [Kandeliimicrobium roseum]
MDLELGGKKVLVTGGSKGIGLATARAFGAEGAAVTLVARNAEALEAAAEGLRAEGIAADTLAADLSTDTGRGALFSAVPDVDVLVNNAGAIRSGSLAEVSMEDFHEGWALKVFGYIHLCKLYVARMREKRAGTIVNIIGMGGRATRPSYIIGAAGNAALIGFTQALGAETPADGVRVFGINPSATLTDRMGRNYRGRAAEQLGDESRWRELIDPAAFPFGRPKRPEEVAAMAVMLSSPKVQYLSGTVVDMDGGGRWT